MIGPLTLMGWLAIIGVVALIVVMARLGWRGRWGVGMLLTLPFIALLVWVEATTAGPPMWKDPYGPLLFMIIVGPIAAGWLAFFLFRLGRHLQRYELFRN